MQHSHKSCANIYNILPRPAVFSGLIIVKLKQDLKYWDHLYFESVCSHIIYQVLAYLESHNKFYEDISIARITAYHTLPRLKSRRPFWMRPIFQSKEFNDFFLKKNIRNYQKIAQIFFKKPNIDHYMERPTATFCHSA